MAGALSVGMAPTATFAADTTAETSAEGELEGELDSADTEEPSENPAETPEEPAEDPAETPEDPAETPAETTADPTEAPAAEETDEQAAEAGSAIVIGGDSFTSLEEAFAAVPDCEDMIMVSYLCKLKGTIEVNNTINVPERRISCWLLLKIILRSNVQPALLRVCLLLMVVIFRWQAVL